MCLQVLLRYIAFVRDNEDYSFMIAFDLHNSHRDYLNLTFHRSVLVSTYYQIGLMEVELVFTSYVRLDSQLEHIE